jgi:hypothetical protein
VVTARPRSVVAVGLEREREREREREKHHDLAWDPKGKEHRTMAAGKR